MFAYTANLLAARSLATVDVLVKLSLTPAELLEKPFDNAEWKQKLQEYLAQEPSARVYDSLDAVAALQNRQSMLAPLAEPIRLHPLGSDTQEAHTAQRDMLSCAAPVQVPLQAGTIYS